MNWLYKIFWAAVVVSSLMLTACGQQKKSGNNSRRGGSTFRTTGTTTQQPVANTPISKFMIDVTGVLRQVFDDGTVLHTFDVTVNGQTVNVATDNDPYADMNGVFTKEGTIGGLSAWFQSMCLNKVCDYSVLSVMIYNETTGESKQAGALIGPSGTVESAYEGVGSDTQATMLSIDQLAEYFFPQ